jgi:thymidylate kinase
VVLLAPVAQPCGAVNDVHPRLVAGFESLDEAGTRWCLLRGRENLRAPTGDVDLLFHPEDAQKGRLALARAGFAPVRIWGGGTQNFFLTWDRDTELWLYVHAVTEISFGPYFGLRIPARGLFQRSERVDGIPMPSRDDRFWITLLHALMDKGRIRESHRSALAGLAPLATPDGEIAKFVDRVAQPASAQSILSDARAGRWDAIEALAHTLASRWNRLDPQARVRAFQHRSSLMATKLAETVTRRGVSVALLAPDGAGKSTIADALATSLYFPVRRFYLGLEGGKFAGSGRSRLPGMGFLKRLFHVWGSYFQARYHQARRRFVIFDRYPYEALLPGATRAGVLSRARRNLLGRSLPAPDLIVVLDAPGEVLHRRKPEHPIERLDRDREGYRALAKRFPRALVVDATRPLEEVRRDVTEGVWLAYRRRCGTP